MSIPSHLSNRGTLLINPASTASGALETNLRGTAWWVLDYAPLVATPDYRGKSLLVSHRSGRVPYKRRVDETTFSLQLIVTGDKTSTGGNHAASLTGLRINLDYLRDNVCGPYSTSSTAATRRAKFTDDNSVVRWADVQVSLGPPGEDFGAHNVRVPMMVTLPAGVWSTSS